jgi:hypothetical protein
MYYFSKNWKKTVIMITRCLCVDFKLKHILYLEVVNYIHTYEGVKCIWHPKFTESAKLLFHAYLKLMSLR